MSDKIKQPGNVRQITPLDRVRDSVRHKKPKKTPARPAGHNHRRPPTDEDPHRVDEYV